MPSTEVLASDVVGPVGRRRTAPLGSRALNAAVALLLAWGALAFGAVYPWAYTPLLVGSAALGAIGCWIGRQAHARTPQAWLLVTCLAAVAAGAAAQTIPLPHAARVAVSPATEPFLRQHDTQYASALALREQGSTMADALPVPNRPLSIDPGATARGALMLASLIVLLAGLTRAFSRTGIVALVPWIVGLGLLLAVVGIVQKAVLGDHAWGGMKIYGFWAPKYKLTTPFGPFVNKNHYAGWMLMALPLAVGYFLAMAETGLRHVRHGWRNRILWLSSPEGGRLQLMAISVLVMGAALVLTMSRSGMAGFVAAMLIAGVLGLRGRGSTRARLAFGAALLVLLVAPFSWTDVDIAERFTAPSQSFELRRRAWRQGAAIVADFPLVGTGLNTFGAATRQYKVAATDLHFREAHNEYLQVAAEGGLLLALPALLAAVVAVRAIRRRLREDADDPVAYWVRFGAATGLLAIALQSLVEFSLQMPGNAVFFVVLLAAALHRRPAHARHPATAQ